MADETTDTQTSTETTATTEAATTATTAETANDTSSAASTDTGAADEGSILGSATTEAGTGDTKSDSQQGPTPTPVPDDNGVPEAYELKLTTTNEAGEETAIDLDPALVETATPLLKDAGLSNEAANKLMPLVPKIQEQLVKQQQDSFAQVRAEWAKEVKADPEMGGPNYNETVTLSAKALDRFGAPSEIVDGKETNKFRVLLNESGLGNHPDFVRFMRNVGAAVSEDGTFVRNTSEPQVKLSREQKLYPEDQPKS